ncbi:hypothetical protein H1P_1040011 [Hyella patelloides LEGE 07179]|uniref:Uncharacterized protein n=1 Tax=Hyella patelloides LEGE 07179 TaxID=945734 RepID=A0A563VJE7_9CYAN|nr:hypothetical protein H1P_1040011 [Hyella patelloides LEGE 07179]
MGRWGKSKRNLLTTNLPKINIKQEEINYAYLRNYRKAISSKKRQRNHL